MATIESHETLGKYRVLGAIDSDTGGVSESFHGFDPLLGRRVALHTFPAGDEERRARFLVEAEIGAELHHKNVVKVLDFGVDLEVSFLAEEEVAGETLDRRIARRAFLPYPEKLYYLLQIARALAYAHGRGAVHRDLRPVHVILRDDGTAKLRGFGIARLVLRESGISGSGLPLDAGAHLAPEQIRGGTVGPWSDVFSFGVLTYRLLTYERPFPARQMASLLEQILRDPPRPMPEVWPAAPRQIIAFTERCLEKEPRRRFVDGADLVRALERLRRSGRP